MAEDELDALRKIEPNKTRPLVNSTRRNISIRDDPLQTTLSRKHIYKLFKWFLITFNCLLIVMVLGGAIAYFIDLRDQTKSSATEEATFSDDLKPPNGASKGPKYAWIVSMFAFALLVAIPCLGFVGAIKENICLLTLYSVIFLLEAIVFLIFGSMWFLFPTLVSLSSFGLVFLINSNKEASGDHTGKRSLMRLCLDKV